MQTKWHKHYSNSSKDKYIPLEREPIRLLRCSLNHHCHTSVHTNTIKCHFLDPARTTTILPRRLERKPAESRTCWDLWIVDFAIIMKAALYTKQLLVSYRTWILYVKKVIPTVLHIISDRPQEEPHKLLHLLYPMPCLWQSCPVNLFLEDFSTISWRAK